MYERGDRTQEGEGWNQTGRCILIPHIEHRKCGCVDSSHLEKSQKKIQNLQDFTLWHRPMILLIHNKTSLWLNDPDRTHVSSALGIKF